MLLNIFHNVKLYVSKPARTQTIAYLTVKAFLLFHI